jgi:hypothetical protein
VATLRFSLGPDQTRGLRVGLILARKEAAMPVWLEVVLNLAGYVGFLALAARSTSRGGHPNDDHTRGDKT